VNITLAFTKFNLFSMKYRRKYKITYCDDLEGPCVALMLKRYPQSFCIILSRFIRIYIQTRLYVFIN